RLCAPSARREQRGARLLELRAHGGDVAAEELGELLDLERDVQDVAMLEVAGAGDVPVAGRQLSDFFTKELHELAFVPEEEAALLALAVGILCRVVAADRIAHLAHDVVERL